MGLFNRWRNEGKKTPGSEPEHEQPESEPLNEEFAQSEGVAMSEAEAADEAAAAASAEAEANLRAEQGQTREDEPQEESQEASEPEQVITPAEKIFRNVVSPAYPDSSAHLVDELDRIDQLIRAQIVSLQNGLKAGKEKNLWGLIQVDQTEVERFLDSKYAPKQTFFRGREQERIWEAAKKKAEAIRKRCDKTPGSVPLRLQRLLQLFALENLERDALLVCLLPQIDSRYRHLFGYLQEDPLSTRPTVELVLEILDPLIDTPAQGRELFDPRGRLLANQLLALGPGPQGDESLLVRPVSVDDRIAGYLLGSQAIDPRLAGIVSEVGESVEVEDLLVSETLEERVRQLAAWWKHQAASVELPESNSNGATFFLHGPAGSPVRKTARAICGAAEPPTRLLEVDTTAALRSPHGFEQVVRLAFREAQLRESALHWLGCEALHQRDVEPGVHPVFDAHWDALTAAAERFDGAAFLSSTVLWDPAGRFHAHPFLRLIFSTPPYDVREEIWKVYLNQESHMVGDAARRDEMAKLLANSFQLTEGQVSDSIATARQLAEARSPADPLVTAEDLFEGCRRQSGRGLSSLAIRLEPQAGMTIDNLILPPASKRQLEELRKRIHLHGRGMNDLGLEERLQFNPGLVVLFTGSPGTGKTMAAELLAAEMHVDLYKVDLSAILSKWIGETEQHLARLFDEAEEMNAFLFFDEADSLAGKRGEIKDATDRYANIQVNYLLQRIERFRGVVIMATNLRQNLELAFMRRIQASFDFPSPGEEERFKIWQGMFPDKKLIDHPQDSDLRELARQFTLNGAAIRNVVHAAIDRARADAKDHEKPEITLRHLVLSVADDYYKSGIPVTKGAFGAKFYPCIEEYTQPDSPEPGKLSADSQTV